MSEAELTRLVNIATQARESGDLPLAWAAMERALQIAPQFDFIRERHESIKSQMGALTGASRISAAEADWVLLLREVPFDPGLILSGIFAFHLTYRLLSLSSNGRPLKPYFRAWLGALSIVGILTGLSLSALQNWALTRDRGILLQNTAVRNGPGEHFQEIGRAPGGVRVILSEVRLDSTQRAWAKAQYDRGKKGWVPLEQIGPTVPGRNFDVQKN